VSIRPLLLALVAVAALACSDDSNSSPASTATTSPRAVAPHASTTAVPTSTTTAASRTTPSITLATRLPERCVARFAPIYPNAATEAWVPSPETDDAIRDFATLVLGWTDVEVAEARADGPVTVLRITGSASPRPVELITLPGDDGRPAAVCSARSVVDAEWSGSLQIEGAQVVSAFGIRSSEGATRPVHEVFPDVVSSQLLVSHGPHVQQTAATDPEQGWSFELDHPTTEPGWQLAFWRDADGAALAVVDTPLPAGDVAAG
jgi:hypothetical protein